MLIIHKDISPSRYVRIRILVPIVACEGVLSKPLVLGLAQPYAR